MSVKKYALPLILDVFLVIVFCAIGRQTHDEENAIAGLATTAWPFLSGLLIGWAATYALYRDKFDAYLVIPTGVIVWLSTVILGMALRIGVSGHEFKITFVMVATLSLAVFLLGWRALAPLVARIRTKS